MVKHKVNIHMKRMMKQMEASHMVQRVDRLLKMDIQQKMVEVEEALVVG